MKIRTFLLWLSACLVFSGTVSAQSSRSGVGAIPYADAGGTGVTFRTWAPNATTVSALLALHAVRGTGVTRIDQHADVEGSLRPADAPFMVRPGRD